MGSFEDIFKGFGSLDAVKHLFGTISTSVENIFGS